MKAKFISWQTGSGDGKIRHMALYNLESGTTVTEATLKKIGRKVPETPTYEEWFQAVRAGLRCRSCWSDETCDHRAVA